MRVKNLMGSGFSAGQATNLIGPFAGGLTATGTDLVTALQLSADVNVVTTTASSTGVRLPTGALGDIQPGDEFKVVNLGANALAVFPSSALGVVNGGSPGAAVSLPTLKTAIATVTSVSTAGNPSYSVLIGA